MHPVVKNLLARKGKSGPFSDNRRIALLLYGGLMSCVRSVGALEHLQDLGLSQSFDDIYGVSAGYPIGASFAAGKIHDVGPVLDGKIDYDKFIHPWRFWNIMDTGYFVNRIREELPDLQEAALAGQTRVHGRVVEKSSGQRQYLEMHEVGPENFYPLMEATIAVPALTIHPIKIGDKGYSDTNFIPYLAEHLQHVLLGPHTDIVVIYNFHLQRIKHISKTDRVLEIQPPNRWKLSHFERDAAMLQAARRQMRSFMEKFF